VGFDRRHGFTGVVFGNLHVGLGVAPALLFVLVARMHELNFGAGNLALSTREAGLFFHALGLHPQIIAQLVGLVDQRGLVCGVGRVLNQAALGQVAGDFDGLVHGQLREAAAVVAAVFVQAHVEPALGFGQAVAVDVVGPRVVEGFDGQLLGGVAFVVGVDAGVGLGAGVAQGGRRWRGHFAGAAGEQEAGQCKRAEW
jgi:hypothetical protein